MAQSTVKPFNCVLSVDFDGVVSEVEPGKRMGIPAEGAKQGLEDLEERGYSIVIHTVRAATGQGKDAVEAWLDYYDLPYSQVTNRKPNALAYIDDKAIRHYSWPATLAMLDQLTGQDE